MAKKKVDRFQKAFGGNGVDPGKVSWDVADPYMLKRLVDGVTAAGGAVLFGTTRDGGAYTLTFFHDDVPEKNRTQYQGPGDDVPDWLEHWADFWEGAAEDVKAPKTK